MFKTEKTPLIQVLSPWVFSSSVQGIGKTRKTKKSDTLKKSIVKEVDFSGRNTPEPVKGNTDCLWGRARGHSCQMGPGFCRRSEASEKEWRLGRGGRAELTMLRKTAGAGTRKAHQAPERQPCSNEGHCAMTLSLQGLDQTSWEEVAVSPCHLTPIPWYTGCSGKGLTQILRGGGYKNMLSQVHSSERQQVR
jgi:hypothetical protein